MKSITLSDGRAFPLFGLGTWQSPPNDVYLAVREALRIGYRHIDCAAVYGNEHEVGRALEDAFAAGDAKREDLWITSKLWNNAHAPDAVRPALEKTLSDLRLDYVDLYLIHWPVALKPDASFPFKAADFVSLEEIPLASTWQAVVDGREAGLARSIGVSNMGPVAIQGLIDDVGVVPAVDQVESHPFLSQLPLKAYCDGHDIALTAYSPLGSGGRAFKAKNEPSLMADPTIVRIGEAHDASPAQILIAWSIQRGVAVIPKSTNAGRIAQNLAACEVELSADEMASIAELNRDFRYIDGSFWTKDGSGYSQEQLWG